MTFFSEDIQRTITSKLIRVDNNEIIEIVKYYNSINQFYVAKFLLDKYSVENNTNIADLSHNLIFQYVESLKGQS